MVVEIDFSNLNPSDLVRVNADQTGFDPVHLSENLQFVEVDGVSFLDSSIREYDKTTYWSEGDSNIFLLAHKVSYLRQVLVNGVKLTEVDDYIFSGINVVEITKTLNDGDVISIHYQHNLKDTLADVAAPTVSKISIQSFK